MIKNLIKQAESVTIDWKLVGKGSLLVIPYSLGLAIGYVVWLTEYLISSIVTGIKDGRGK